MPSEATLHHIYSKGFVAEEAVYGMRFVILGTDPVTQVKMPTAGNLAGIGLVVGNLDEEFAAGQSVSVAILGLYRVKAGGVISAGDRVEIKDATGEVITCVGAGHHNSVGYAFVGAADHGEAHILLTPGGAVDI